MLTKNKCVIILAVCFLGACSDKREHASGVVPQFREPFQMM